MMKSIKSDLNMYNESTIIIRPTKGWVNINLREIWDRRDLIYFLSLRDIKVRYKQTLLGIAWSIFQPLLMMIAFTLFFSMLAKVPSEGLPYPLFNYTALIPWTLFAGCISGITNSMVNNAQLIKKVYFPRMIIPISCIATSLVDFTIAFVILIVMMFYFGFMPSISILCVPLLLLITVITALGVGLWLSALNTKYRDVQYVVPFMLQVWLFASPIIYSSSMIPTKYQLIYHLNPMVGIVEGFRWALLGTSKPGLALVISAIIAVIILISGAFIFQRMERSFADEV